MFNSSCGSAKASTFDRRRDQKIARLTAALCRPGESDGSDLDVLVDGASAQQWHLYDPFWTHRIFEEYVRQPTTECWWENRPGRYVAWALRKHGLTTDDAVAWVSDDMLIVMSCVAPQYGPAIAVLGLHRDVDVADAGVIARIVGALRVRQRRLHMLAAAGWEEGTVLPPWAAAISTTARQMIDITGLNFVHAWAQPRDCARASGRVAAGGTYSETWFAFGEAIMPRAPVDLMRLPRSSPHCDFEGCWVKISGHLADRIFLDQHLGTALEFDVGGLPETILVASVGRTLGDLVDMTSTALTRIFAGRLILSARSIKSELLGHEILRVEIEDTIETLSPTPQDILASIDRADHPLAASRFPWWLFPDD